MKNMGLQLFLLQVMLILAMLLLDTLLLRKLLLKMWMKAMQLQLQQELHSLPELEMKSMEYALGDDE